MPTRLGTAASPAATAWAGLRKPLSLSVVSAKVLLITGAGCPTSTPEGMAQHRRRPFLASVALPAPRGESAAAEASAYPVPLTPFQPRSRPLSLSEARRCSRTRFSLNGAGVMASTHEARRPRRLHLSGIRSHLAADLSLSMGSLRVQRILPPRRRQTGSCRRRRGGPRQQTAGSTGGFSAPAPACRR